MLHFLNLTFQLISELFTQLLRIITYLKKSVIHCRFIMYCASCKFDHFELKKKKTLRLNQLLSQYIPNNIQNSEKNVQLSYCSTEIDSFIIHCIIIDNKCIIRSLNMVHKMHAEGKKNNANVSIIQLFLKKTKHNRNLSSF